MQEEYSSHRTLEHIFLLLKKKNNNKTTKYILSSLPWQTCHVTITGCFRDPSTSMIPFKKNFQKTHARIYELFIVPVKILNLNTVHRPLIDIYLHKEI